MNRNLRIGIFTAMGVVFIVGFSVYVNDHPFWYRPCNEVKIHVDDATGLRRKSPVKTLGLDIGYINKVDLDGDRVMVNVCVTGNVKLNPETRAYIRSSGFLGDKFLELKPVDRLDGKSPSADAAGVTPPAPATDTSETERTPQSGGVPTTYPRHVEPTVVPVGSDGAEGRKPDSSLPAEEISLGRIVSYALDHVGTKAYAARGEETPTLNASREAELQDTMKKVGKLVDQLALMVGDLREVTNQKEFKETIINLNQAMKNLEQLLRPSGKVVKNFDSAMESMRNTMADAEAVVKKIKEGEGAVGKFINDPAIYDELRGAIQSVNLMLGKAGALKTYVDLSGWQVPAYGGGKARLHVIIAPNPGRYYLLGVASDPRGRDRRTVTTISVNGQPSIVETRNVNEERKVLFTAMFGKYFGPLDLRVGILEDNATAAVGYWFDQGRRYGAHVEVFSTGRRPNISYRAYARAQVWSGLYLTGGLESNHTYFNPNTLEEKRPFFFGAGLFFDDDDLKYLFAFI
jgi:phospholipid/cholesterol/gamma-HCH transport system substrate-binding protein